MLPVLILLRPLDLKTGLRIDIRVGSSPDATALGLNDQDWEPIVSRRPRIAQDLMSLDLDGKFKLAAADFVLSMNLMSQYRFPDRLYWVGAPVTIWSVEGLHWSRRVVEFDGLITTAPLDLVTKKMTINASVDRTRIDKPLLTGEFNADGQAGGGPEMRGRVYPAGFGYMESVEWVLFDSINNIGMLDGYGNLMAVNKAMEGLATLGPSVGDFASYALLKQAVQVKTIPPGRWGTCLAQGMVALGAPPVGRITFHATFGANRTGAILKRVLRVHGGLPDTGMIGDSFDALDIVANYEVRAHFKDQIQISDVIEQMCQPLNATPLITVQNKVALTLSTAAAPVATLNRSASSPPLVTAWRSAEPLVPIYKVIYRAERPGDVLGYSEVNYVDDLIDRGLFDITETYRQGHLVWLADKSQWLYVFPTPQKGHVPGDPQDGGNYWTQLQPATDATTIYYPSGKTVAELEPAEAGADVTKNNTAKDTLSVGGREAVEVLLDIENTIDGTLANALRQEDYERVQAARTFLDGEAPATYFLNFRNEQIGKVSDLQKAVAGVKDTFTPINAALDAQVRFNRDVGISFDTVGKDNFKTRTDITAVNTSLSLLGARTADGKGWVLDLQTVQVGNGKTLAERLDEVGVDNGATYGSVAALSQAVVDLEGNVNTRYTLALNAKGKVAGMYFGNNGEVSRLVFLTDEFSIASETDGVVVSPFTITGGVVYMTEVVVSKLTVGAVKTDNIEANSVTGLLTQSFPDIAIPAVETTIAEWQNIQVGDAVDGLALIDVQFTQDGSVTRDTAILVNAYIKMPGAAAYTLVRSVPQGIVVSGGSAYWILPVSFSIPVLANGLISIRITARGYSFAGAVTSGSFARNIQLNVFAGAR
jgi:hypothetical protein